MGPPGRALIPGTRDARRPHYAALRLPTPGRAVPAVPRGTGPKGLLLERSLPSRKRRLA